MAILQTKKQTDLEKRLKLLRLQIYGKSSNQPVRVSVNQNPNTPASERSELTHRYTDTPKHSIPAIKTDISYLYQDLFKIGLLATFALGVQIILFFLTKNHIIILNFF